MYSADGVDPSLQSQWVKLCRGSVTVEAGGGQISGIKKQAELLCRTNRTKSTAD